MSVQRWRIPKTLEECYREEDSTSKKLETYADIVEKLGKAVLIIILVIGFVLSVKEGLDAAAEFAAGFNRYVRKIERLKVLVPTFIWSFIPWAVGAFVEYCVYHLVALLITAVSELVKNTKVIANVDIYNSSKGIISADEESKQK